VEVHQMSLCFRSHSPKTKNTQIRDDSSKSAYDINYHAKQVRHSLTHFKDVIAKNKLEMLSGNGTIVLETIANVHSALKAQKLNNTHNSAIISGKYCSLNLKL
jgi:Rap guanine nucleotide exchange factor 1